MKKYYNSYLVAAFLYCLPLLIANIYYIDDNGRATLGYTNWGGDGRPLADIIMKMMFLSSHVADIFPLPLIISIALLAFVFSLYHKQNFSSLPGWIGALATLSFFANPYLAEVFSYRFDVLTLSCALALSLAWVLLPPLNRIVRFVIGIAIIIAIYSLYQIAVNVAVMMALVVTFRQIINNDRPAVIFMSLLQRGVEVLVASIIYLKIVLPSTFSGDHPANHPNIAGNQLWLTINHNVQAYWDFINQTFYKDGKGMAVLVAILILAVISAAVIALRYIRAGMKHSRIAIGLLALLLPLVAFVMIAGNLLFLENALLVPRALLSISGFMLFSATLMAWAFRGKMCFVFAVMAVPLLYAVTSIYVYGNAIKQQDNINQGVVYQLKNDTATLADQNFYMQFVGTSPRAQVYKNALRNYPVLGVLIPEYFANWWFPFPYMALKGYQVLNPLKDDLTVTNENLHEGLCQGERIAHHQDYDLYKYQNRLTVDFTLQGCQR
ncbi:glucosyltransferase domain-containing protein [Pantoea phytobeneficialis]|uniref:Glucosyltransferase domain-containing protein n=1 Tax=Pantoea phytobeneficialis TaxID=2052056 RepID=A0AAP9KQM5_9GAMM|nr:glucosyltransferase domain-containing protein [Pantoea phytobeneficialis]MDO6408410.1 glucosyltransferase domain-containing protein [Pantoea phytobeneficialis]QGR08201.1 hypothetical protein CTZ24_17935 [Pantoea phytobeneficialis]